MHVSPIELPSSSLRIGQTELDSETNEFAQIIKPVVFLFTWLLRVIRSSPNGLYFAVANNRPAV